MKKISFLFCFFLVLGSFAQTNSDSIVSPIVAKKNEVKIDALNLISNGRLGISYERFLNTDFSVGITGMFLNKSSKKDNFNFQSTINILEVALNSIDLPLNQAKINVSNFSSELLRVHNIRVDQSKPRLDQAEVVKIKDNVSRLKEYQEVKI